MFGFGKKEPDYSDLSKKQIREMEKNMTARERKELQQKNSNAKDEKEWDDFCLMDLLDD